METKVLVLIDEQTCKAEYIVEAPENVTSGEIQEVIDDIKRKYPGDWSILDIQDALFGELNAYLTEIGGDDNIVYY